MAAVAAAVVEVPPVTDRRPLGWALLLLGLGTVLWAVARIATGGEGLPLLTTGLGCLTVWIALREELQESDQLPDHADQQPA